MKLKNLRLTLANVNTSTTRKEMEVVEVSTNRVRLDDGTMGRDIDSYAIHCAAHGGDVLKIKTPKELATKVTQLADALGDDVTVLVTFTGLRLKAFAMKSGDSVISGISAKADDFSFRVQSADTDDEILL